MDLVPHVLEQLDDNDDYVYYSRNFKHHKTASKIHHVKSQQRTDIRPSQWTKQGYAKTNVCTYLLKNNENIPRLKQITYQEFVNNFEIPRKPAILLNQMKNWKSNQNWTIENLAKNYRNALFKVGQDDDGHKLTLKLKYFFDYMKHQKDDSPLYLFESNLEEYTKTEPLVHDWKIPDVFPFDMHSVLDEHRPPYKWFLIGPKRSGTTIHVDPLNTAAWNALQSGVKRWVLFEPNVPVQIVKGTVCRRPNEDTEAIDYFTRLLPRIKEKYSDVKVYECLQKPGEVIYVPPKWWHAVINLEDTVACTQNFVSPCNFDVAWRAMKASRPSLAPRWKRRLRRFYPEFAKRIGLLDEYDRKYGASEFTSSSDSDSSSSSSGESTSGSEDYAAVGDYLELRMSGIGGETRGAMDRFGLAVARGKPVDPKKGESWMVGCDVFLEDLEKENALLRRKKKKKGRREAGSGGDRETDDDVTIEKILARKRKRNVEEQ